jgi:hypothetical protein
VIDSQSVRAADTVPKASPGLLTQARAEVHGLRASAPAADQLVFGDAVLGEKAFRVVVLDRVR